MFKCWYDFLTQWHLKFKLPIFLNNQEKTRFKECRFQRFTQILLFLFSSVGLSLPFLGIFYTTHKISVL